LDYNRASAFKELDPILQFRATARLASFLGTAAVADGPAYPAGAESHAVGLVNSFTRAAQRLGAVERIEVERLAGRLLAMQTLELGRMGT